MARRARKSSRRRSLGSVSTKRCKAGYRKVKSGPMRGRCVAKRSASLGRVSRRRKSRR